jgi:hypothetical protein
MGVGLGFGNEADNDFILGADAAHGRTHDDGDNKKDNQRESACRKHVFSLERSHGAMYKRQTNLVFAM